MSFGCHSSTCSNQFVKTKTVLFIPFVPDKSGQALIQKKQTKEKIKAEINLLKLFVPKLKIINLQSWNDPTKLSRISYAFYQCTLHLRKIFINIFPVNKSNKFRLFVSDN